jgi:hypothetical protein
MGTVTVSSPSAHGQRQYSLLEFKCFCSYQRYTGHTQKNGAVLIVNTIKTAPFVCVCPYYLEQLWVFDFKTIETNK